MYIPERGSRKRVRIGCHVKQKRNLVKYCSHTAKISVFNLGKGMRLTLEQLIFFSKLKKIGDKVAMY